jgi:hypothetical protein
MQATCSCHTRLCRRLARRGARIGRLGAPCKAGRRWCSLTHGARSRRAPHFRAIGGPVGRAALRLETGRATCRSRTAQDPNAPEICLNARGSCERAGPDGWGKPATLQRNSLSRPPGRRGASPRRGRVAGPEVLGGKARKIPDLVARGARAGFRPGISRFEIFKRRERRGKWDIFSKNDYTAVRTHLCT